MEVKKIIVISLIFMVFAALATVFIVQLKPQMHKSLQFQQIIFKRSK
jgi:hypothetical protein